MKLKLVFTVIICILCTVSCRTVKEIEEEKEEKVTIFGFEIPDDAWTDHGDFQSTEAPLHMGLPPSTYIHIGCLIASFNHVWGTNFTTQEEIDEWMRQNNNRICREKVTVSPNPTASSATINMLALGPEATFGFRYKLVFDGKIIFENDIPASKSKIVIHEHLLQNRGTYVVAYEVYLGANTFCANSISFMVTRQQ